MNVPQHVTIIMDGNGRWARKQGQQRLFGHNEGVESVRACTEYAAQAGVKYLSIFAFSEENWNRSDEEVAGLMTLMFKSVLGERETFRRNHIRFRVIGNRAKLPSDLLKQIEMVEKETEENDGMQLIVMLSYSGKWDIVQAASRYAADVASGKVSGELTEDIFAGYLATAGVPDPDLMIRTSGELRISNYMLWQCAYTEFYFTDTLWPDFRKEDFMAALEAYSSRERRYGKIK